MVQRIDSNRKGVSRNAGDIEQIKLNMKMALRDQSSMPSIATAATPDPEKDEDERLDGDAA